MNHKNEVKTDNRVENLEWVTAKENCNYGTCIERRSQKKKKPINQYTKDDIYIKTFPSSVDIERELGYNRWAISKVCRGVKHYNTAYGYKWRYKD